MFDYTPVLVPYGSETNRIYLANFANGDLGILSNVFVELETPNRVLHAIEMQKEYGGTPLSVDTPYCSLKIGEKTSIVANKKAARGEEPLSIEVDTDELRETLIDWIAQMCRIRKIREEAEKACGYKNKACTRSES